MLARSLFSQSGLAFFLIVSLAFPQSRVPDSVYQLAGAEMQKGDFAGAEATLRSTLKSHPRDPQALGMLGVALDAEKNYKQAGIYYAEALRLDPHSTSLLNNLGNHDLALGDITRARQRYLQVIALDPHHPNANLQLARISIQAGEGRAALRYLAELPADVAHQVAVALLRAKALRMAGKQSEAETLLKTVANAGAGDPRVDYSAGMMEVEWKNYKEAEQFLRGALDADPTNFDILYNLGLSALDAGDLTTARQMLAVAIAQRPDDVDTLYNLGWLNTRSGNDEKAIVRLVRAHQLAPDRADVMLLIGQVSENLGFYGDAAEAFNHYLKLKPHDELVRREYGFALAHTAKIDESVTVLRAYASRHPEDARGFYELGVAESVHDQERAAADLKRAISLDPKLSAADYALAEVLYQQAHYHRAAGILKPLIRQDPNDYRALEVLGEVELQLNNLAQATGYLGRAAGLAPKNRRILLQYGQALERAHQHQQALAVLQRFHQLPPVESRPYSGLVDYLSMTPEQQEAQYLQHLQGKMEANPEDLALKVSWAKALLSQGKISDSLQTFDQILAQRPSEPILKDCGAALLARAQFAEARKFFSAAALSGYLQPGDILNLSIAIFHTTGPAAALMQLDRTPPAARQGDYYLLRAQILDAMDQPHEAASDLTLGLKADPTRPDLYFEAALFLIKHNQPAELLAVLRQAVDEFPDSQQLLLTEAIIYGLMRRFEKSNQIMNQIEAHWPQSSEAYLIHAIILVGQAKMREAKPLLETAIALGNKDPLAEYNLALSDMEIFPADVPGAAKAIQVALKLDPKDPYTQSLAGKIAFTEKNYQAALEHLNAAIRLWPDMIEARQTLSGTYRALGDKEKSAAELKEVLLIQQRIRSPDQAPPSDLKNLLFSVPAPSPPGS
ncbi:MAG: tetratricopeptide repeat protein [Terriglobia bacterium]